MQIVYYFDKPTIGYCSKCDEIATWDNIKGLHCPKCMADKDEISIFEYQNEGPYPE